MTFQAYLDTVKAKTGLDPEDFRTAAAAKGLLAEGTKTAAILAWLKADYGLGPGHGMAIASTFTPQPASAERLEKQFGGAKVRWRPVYEALLTTLSADGPVGVAPTDTYISLLKGTAKFAIVAFTADRMDVGLKLKAAVLAETVLSDRFEASGSWNSMVTHRVRVTDASQVDAELLQWLRKAYAAA